VLSLFTCALEMPQIKRKRQINEMFISFIFIFINK
jgi:hypothetical protein